MMIIGCDFHPSGQQVFGIETSSGEVVANRWIAHTGEPARACAVRASRRTTGEFL